eukprot:38165-Amphidinium_carterae.1
MARELAARRANVWLLTTERGSWTQRSRYGTQAKLAVQQVPAVAGDAKGFVAAVTQKETPDLKSVEKEKLW